MQRNTNGLIEKPEVKIYVSWISFHTRSLKAQQGLKEMKQYKAPFH